MLEFIKIKNFALIKEETIQFREGIHIITGETGSGKSLILDSIYSILGTKSNIIDIRNESNSYKIEALFNINKNECAKKWLLEKNLENEENRIILTRELYRDGKNKITINSSLTTLSNLKELGKIIAETHKQNEQLEIFNPEKQLEFIDDFGNLQNLKNKVKKQFFLYQEIKKKLEKLKLEEKLRLEKVENLEFQINEIETLNLKQNEEKNLLEEEKSLIYFEQINKNLEEISYNIHKKEDSAINLMYQVENSINSILKVQPKFENLQKIAKEVSISLEEMNREISSQISVTNYNPQTLEEIQTRLAKIQKMKKKYYKFLSSDETLDEYLKSLHLSLEKIQEDRQELIKIEKEFNLVVEVLQNLSLELSENRQETISKLEPILKKEVKEVSLNDAKFQFKLNWTEHSKGDFFHNKKSYLLKEEGLDSVELYFTANLGEKLYPIKKIASGGEISRLMLVFKNILGKKAKKSLMIFDEIDTGIGGETANQVAKKLENISNRGEHQIILVTHLQQIAKIAHHHYRSQKHIENNRTVSKISYIQKEERAVELAKMISGLKITKGSIQHAKELLLEKTTT